uniref:Alpha-1,6-mannosyl-glycoprotein 2-beta-N-acetylglucosaminyltransferase n=1 Tax=Panagrolaimus sp. JU765 TaxID=591449 RepID=A0AC34QKI0_9BILA
MMFKRKLSRCLTFIFVISVFCLASLLLSSFPVENRDLPYDYSVLNKTVAAASAKATTLPPADKLNNSKYDDKSIWKDLFQIPEGFEDIVQSFHFLNFHHEVKNEAIFGPVNTSEVVIVVQVHERLEYLKYLISTLKETKGIEKALVVFSHDMNHDEINAEIQKIDFCRVIQIFFPYNIQVFANVFPGSDPADCSSNSTKLEALASGCKNYLNHDSYGHYRIPGISQIKHHWWWKMNYVFDGIIRRYNLTSAYVVLLEEDHYVSPDFIHVLQMMAKFRPTICPTCKILTLGIYLKNYKSYLQNIDKFGVNYWFSSKHNMGMAFTYETWEEIRNCSRLFCVYDDYNWDWSLLQISLKCLPEKLRVLFVKSPRVIHIGECGVHTHRCGIRNAAESARELFATHNASLFPTQFSMAEISNRMLKSSKPNGGWGDLRDQELCLVNSFPNNETSACGRILPRIFVVKKFRLLLGKSKAKKSSLKKDIYRFCQCALRRSDM